jgi:aspartyl-tRNA(Asn)/glutamyl-tRNA(Gln) amidotransferase subunit A
MDITDDILYATVAEQGKLLQSGKISSVALTGAYLDRLESIGAKLNAIVTVPRQRALDEAKKADAERMMGRARGPLHGIPYGLKDLAATAGLPTTWGAEPYRKQIFTYDATIVRKLREVGAVLVAKLAMIELAGGFGYNSPDASFTGPCKNPWNPDYWTSGSSSGSGAAVAAGLVSFAIGSETSGSIISPSSASGVSGLRPTYGRVSRHGAMALSWTLDKLGVMARSASCCSTVLSAIAGRDNRDPTTSRREFLPLPDRKAGEAKFKVGVARGAGVGSLPEVKKNFDAAVKALAEFCDITDDVPLPDHPYANVIGTIIRCEGASAFRTIIENGECTKLQDATDKVGGFGMIMTPAVDYIDAMRLRTRIAADMAKLYAKFDAIVAPSSGATARPLKGAGKAAAPGPPLIQAGNLAGQPAISVPMGFGANDLPTGLQITGAAWSEAKLLQIAQAYQQATEWHKKRPNLK